MAGGGSKRSGRLARDQRRAHLLDVASQLVLEGGFDSFTMEGVAARAGVSKALPYQHFQNADEILNALCEREERVLDARVFGAFEVGGSLEERILSSLRAYFDALEERGVILTLIHHPLLASRFRRSVLPAWERRTTAMAAHIRRDLGLPPDIAATAARIALAAVLGAISGWQQADAPREMVERVAVEMIGGGFRALANSQPSSAEPARADQPERRSAAGGDTGRG
jgi:AcrR family transcriptional regulator